MRNTKIGDRMKELTYVGVWVTIRITISGNLILLNSKKSEKIPPDRRKIYAKFWIVLDLG